MELTMQILKDYGAWGLLLAVLVYLVQQGRITFRYPRSSRKKNRDGR
jgi:hypothetical protein